MADNTIISKQIAGEYLNAGLCVLPASRDEKFPTVGKWTPFKKRRPTHMEIDAWFSNNADAVCIVCGRVSGNLEIIDFDQQGEAFAPWWAKVDTVDSALLKSLIVETTQSGGWHVAYRCEDEVSGNLKLAQRRAGSKIQTLIETRGQGGLFLCSPTAGYELVNEKFTKLPVITAAQREILLQAARDLNELEPEIPESQPEKNDIDFPSSDNRAGDDYNASGDIHGLLEKHGWTYLYSDKVNHYFRRPGKNKGKSASLRIKDNKFYVFSSNAPPFEMGQAYLPFAVFTMLEHEGDYKAASRALYQLGYGEDAFKNSGVDLSGILQQDDSVEEQNDSESHPQTENTFQLPKFINAIELCRTHDKLHDPVIHGLLREGETMNLIAASKTGKSWLASDLAMAISTGRDWLGKFKTSKGNVLVIDNELHNPTLSFRLKSIATGRKIPIDELGRFDTCSLRGMLVDLHKLIEVLSRLPKGQLKLIILDAFYRFLPKGTDENDNGSVAMLYNSLDSCAAKIGCAFVLIHHTTKGNQSGKSVTDVGAGAGAQSRATDTHVVLRSHKEQDVVVLDAAVRSWPPVKPVCLRWNWPVWSEAAECDPEELQGIKKRKVKEDIQEEVKVEDFVNMFLCDEPKYREDVMAAAFPFFKSQRRVKDLMAQAEGQALIHRWSYGANRKVMFATTRQPVEEFFDESNN